MPPNWWPRNPLLSTERVAGFFHHTPTHLSGAVDENTTAKFGQKFQADRRDKGEVNGGGEAFCHSPATRNALNKSLGKRSEKETSRSWEELPARKVKMDLVETEQEFSSPLKATVSRDASRIIYEPIYKNMYLLPQKRKSPSDYVQWVFSIILPPWKFL